MNQQQITNGLIAAGVPSEHRDSIEEAVKIYAYEVMTQEDWKFLRSSHTQTSTADTHTYTLTGSNSDCGRLMIVKYDNYEIPFVDIAEFDRMINGKSEDDCGDYDVQVWTLLEHTSQGLPSIRFFGTPDETDSDAIFYRYLKLIDESDPFARMPGWMYSIVLHYATLLFHPDPTVRQEAFRNYRHAIGRAHWQERPKTAMYSPGLIDPAKKRRNYDLNFNQGFRPPHITNRVESA